MAAITDPSATAAAPTTASSTTSDGPVLSVISKRLRALHKKLKRISQMEESLSNGKTLNKEQEEVLKSKPFVVAIIDELEKLRSPLSAAVDEELSLSKPEPKPETEPEPQAQPEPKPEPCTEEIVRDLLTLLYFGGLFDVRPQSDFTSLMITRVHERGCCLTYDVVGDDDNAEMLKENDLDAISSLQGMVLSKPLNSALSHKGALERCAQHAKLWVEKSDQPVDQLPGVTYAGLREKLIRIIASDYFTATPQMQAPDWAAAVAVGNFGSFGVPIQESDNVPIEVPVPAEEGSVGQYPETGENAANYSEYETVSGENHSVPVEECQKEEEEPENPREVFSVQTEQEQPPFEGEGGHRDSDFKEQHYGHRGGYRGGRGGRGGRRGGYPNGRGGRGGGSRGGGPYQNGRSQYYDNYYPRNYYNRRGGRGSGGGGNSYYNHASGGQGNHPAQPNVGVAS